MRLPPNINFICIKTATPLPGAVWPFEMVGKIHRFFPTKEKPFRYGGFDSPGRA